MNLPRLLAGPLLRQCSETEVVIWVATSERVSGISVEMQTLPHGRVIRNSSQITLIEIATNLWFYLIRVSPTDSVFPTHTVIGYDVQPFTTAEESSHLIYPGFDQPTIMLQERGTGQFRALYGSCRKYHGPGFDASRAGDQHMLDTLNDTSMRPDVLLLGGDQIYADDVPHTLIRPIQELAKELIGREEPLPGIRIPSSIPIGDRGPVVTGKASTLTSHAADNHLMTFGEYCAAYLLAWNHKLWSVVTIPNWADVFEQMEDKKPPVHKAKAILEMERQTVDEYKAGSKAIQRMMANLPTYMIFDDHEITDDWFLNSAWKKRVLKTELGQRIIANGMAAFWLFQAIGNDVRSFGSDVTIKELAPKIKRHIANLKFDKKATSSSAQEFDSAFAQRKNWSFVTPTSPPIIFLDTRTRRSQSPNHRHSRHGLIGKKTDSFPSSAPRLINKNELAHIETEIKRMLTSDTRIILVSATPIIGLDASEDAINFMIGVGGSASYFDFESYHSDLNSFLDIADVILKNSPQPDLVIALSGDVHYGFSAVGALLNTQKYLRSIPFAQFTSSAMKNRPEGFPEKLLSVLSTKPYSPPTFRFWWRPGSDNAAHSSIKVAPVKADNQGRIGLTSQFVKDQHNNFQTLSNDANARLKFAFAHRYEFASSASLVEKDNNLGLLEVSNLTVSNKLLKWNGSLQASLNTTWDARSWPIEII